MTRARATGPQETSWFHHQTHPRALAYNLAFELWYEGPLRVELIEPALERVVARHPELRRGVLSDGGRPLRCVGEAKVNLSIWTGSAPTEGEARAWMDALANAPFELDAPPLHRFGLISFGPYRHVLVVCIHHAIFDGQSVEPFVDALAEAYRALEAGEPLEAVAEDSPVDAFFEREREWLRSEEAQTLTEGWQDRLRGLEPSPVFGDRAPSEAREAPLSRVGRILSPDESDAVRAAAKALKTTPYTLALASYLLVLGRLSSVQDVATGVPVSLRSRRSQRAWIGNFVNTVVARADTADDPSFEAWVRRVEDGLRFALRARRLPFSSVARATGAEAVDSRLPLVRTLFVQRTGFLPPPLGAAMGDHEEIPPPTLDFDLVGLFTVYGDELRLGAWAREDVFSEASLRRLLTQLDAVLAEGIAAPKRPVSSLGRVPAAPICPPSATPERLYWQDALRERASSEPDAEILFDGRSSWTARALLERVERRAAGIAAQTSPNAAVALVAERSPEQLVTALAVLASGRCLAPLDPAHPPERLQACLRVLQPELTLDAGSDFSALDATAGLPLERPSDEAVAYVIFTSGSTGTPKGVEVTHGSLAAFTAAYLEAAKFPPRPRWLGLTSPSFDAWIKGVMAPIALNGTILVAPVGLELEADALDAWLDRAEADVLAVTPSLFRTLLAGGARGRPGLMYVSGGEPLLAGLARQLLARGARLSNGYGPTETTVNALLGEVEAAQLEGLADETQVAIGRPLLGTGAEILDARGLPCPVGIPGELVLSGPQLARGYLREPEQTARAFPEREGRRSYRTGDRARWRDDGRVELLGRLDAQVKIRGVRIELQEIEAVLAGHPDVAEAAVAVKTSPAGAPMACAYLVMRSGLAPSEDALRARLRSALPPAVIPESFTVLAELPKDPSGKLARSRLPAPTLKGAGPGGPRDRVEGELRLIWKALLGIEGELGPDADFFALGGQSLAAVQLAERVRHQMGFPLKVVDVLTTRTLGQLAGLIRAEGGAQRWRTIVAHRPEGTRPPLFCFGSVQMANALALHLDASIPIYSFNLFGFDPEEGPVPEVSMTELAEAFVADLASVQPEGPYHLLGYCGEALLTGAVAGVLEARGHEVGLLGVVDLIPKKRSRLRALPRLARFAVEGGAPYARAWLGRQRTRAGYRIRGWAAELKRRVGRTLELSARHDLLFRRYLEARDAFLTPPRCAAEIVFLTCEEQLAKTSEAAIMAMTPGPARSVRIPGVHEALFEPPFVAPLCRALETELSRVEDQLPRS